MMTRPTCYTSTSGARKATDSELADDDVIHRYDKDS